VQPHLPEENVETEIAYWRNRVCRLEFLVAELLTKNQAMRCALHMHPFAKSFVISGTKFEEVRTSREGRTE
jgi:hypothetical protein